MKTTVKILILIVTTLSLNPQIITGQCHIDDWYALKQLYLSTDGDNWLNNTGWQEVTGNAATVNCNLENLHGIGLDAQGRVDVLNLHNNELSGSIPPEIGNLTYLQKLWLISNQLSGSIPSELGNLSNLIDLRLNNNELNGSIPSELGNLSSLQILWLSSNQLSESIPPELGNLSSLIDLRLLTNQLSGSIPSELGNLSNLESLHLQWNQLSGIIPPELGNLSSLIYMGLHVNEFIGSIPPELGNLSKLQSLHLSVNQLIGSIPSELGNLINLQGLHLSVNELNGSIPPQLGNLSNLTQLHFHSNQLSGSVPSQLGNLSNLYLLEIHDNNLSGCYNDNLAKLCTQLNHPNFDGDADISVGNNFDATWEDFCATDAGVCVVSDVYPGDLNHDGIVNNQDVGLCGLNLYEIGPPRAPEHQNTNWQAYPADDWNRQHLNNEDIKHFDCNGDGVIDPNDHQAVEDNFGLIWTDTIPAPPPPPQSDYQTMLLPTEQIVDGYLFLNISLERRAGGDLTLQGGYFTIDYSEITGTINFATLGLNYESWLGTRDEDLFYEFEEFPTQKKIEIGFTKTNNLNSTGSGVIGELIISYDSSQSRINGNPIDTQKIKISTIGVHNGNDFTLLEDEIRQVYMGENSCQTNWTITENTPFQNQYKSNSNITTNGFVLIGTDQEVEFNASSRVRINAGFSVKAGADFKVRSNGCD